MNKYLYNLFIRIILSMFIFVLISYLYNNTSLYYKLDNIIFDSNIDFTYIRSKTNYIFKNLIGSSSYVSSEKLVYKSVSKYNNSYKFITDNKYVIKNLYNGNVTYIGNLDNLGYSIIIQGDNGIEYTYSYLENINVNMYDYVNKDIILGNTSNDYFYLTLIKDNEYLEYEKYI